MVRNYDNSDCSLKNNLTVSFIIIFSTLSFPIYSGVSVLQKTADGVNNDDRKSFS